MENIKKFLLNVSVEPTLLLYSFSYFIFYPTLLDLLFTKICYEKFSDLYYCAHNGSARDDESVQGSTSHWILFNTMAFLIPSVFMTLCAGSWSDRFGRKFPLLVPICGLMVTLAGYLLYSHYLIQWPPIVMIILTAVNGAFGGELTVLAVAMSYITDVSDSQKRLFRLSVLEGMLIIGATLGPLTSGQLTHHFGHSSAFSTSLCFVGACLVYTIFFVKNKPSKSESTRSVFNLNHFTDAVKCCFKRRSGNKRKHILLSLFVIFLTFAPFGIESAIVYLFLKDRPLLWNFAQYATLSSINHLCVGFTLLVIMPGLRSYLYATDTFIGIMAGVSYLIKLVILGFSTSDVLVYTSVVLGCFHTLQLVSARSLLSKSADSNEKGKLFSVASILQYVGLFVTSLIANTTWPLVRQVFKGLLFEVSTVFIIVANGVLLVLHKEMKVNRDLNSMAKDNEETDTREIESTEKL